MENMLYDVNSLSENIKLAIIENAKNQVLRLQSGFISDDKFWCKQTYVSMILEALSGSMWLTKEQINSLLVMYQNIDFN